MKLRDAVFGFSCVVAANAVSARAQLAQGAPKPEPAIPAITALFQTYDVVGMDAAHGMKDLDDFILTLVRTAAFKQVVDDIVVECGNARYQAVLDRYIAGEDVSVVEVQHVWQETTGPQMCSMSSFYAQLFPLIRRINQSEPSGKRLRVVAGDAPIDWTAVTNQAGWMRIFMVRDSSIAAVMEREVLSKHHKALMLFGSAHLAHGLSPAAAAAARQMPNGFGVASAVGRYEEHYPGLTFTIDQFGCGASTKWGSAPASWPVPSLLRTRDMRSAAQPNNPFSDFGPDGLLYLGPPELLLNELRPAFPFLEDSLVAELRRRATMMPANPQRDAYVDAGMSDADDPFLCRAGG